MCKAKGFTLIELLIVVAIIAILAAIAVPNFLEAQTRAKVSRARADMRTEATALETYRVDNNEYPRPFDAFQYPNPYYTRGNWHEHIPSSLTTPVAYLNVISMDPFLPKAPRNQAAKVTVEGRHFYFNGPFSQKAIFSDGGTYSIFYTESMEYAGEYAVFSYGPDRSYYNEPAGREARSQGQWIDYDASNGTLSAGNIIRTQKNGEIFGVVPKYLYQ